MVERKVLEVIADDHHSDSTRCGVTVPTNLIMDCEPANRKFERAIARLQVALQNRSQLGWRKRSEREAWANLIEVTLALPFEE